MQARRRTRSKSVLIPLAVGFALLGTPPAFAQAAEPATYHFNIPEQDLGSALRTFGQASGTQLIFDETTVRGKRSPALTGELSAAEALQQLLSGSGLQWRRGQSGVWVIEAAAATGSEGVLLEEILVRATPFTDANVDIVRTENEVQPYYIFGSDEILGSNAVNLETFLRQRLTMNAVSSSIGQQPAEGAGNPSSVNLRGLGLDQTLILVNGRRTTGSSAAAGSASLSQFDINAFAPAMVDRIEVLPSSASAIYGGSAVGGVLNIILKRDFTGGDLRLTYDTPLDEHAPIRTVTGAYGWSLEQGRTHITLSGTFRDNESLSYGDRPELLQRGFTRTLAASPEIFDSPNFPFRFGATTNIAAGEELIFKDGTPLGSSFTFIPVATSAATSAAQLQQGLLANAGKYNMTPPATRSELRGSRAAFEATGETRSVAASIRRKMTDRLELIGELFFNNNELSHSSAADLIALIPSDSPANPFQQDVWIAAPVADSTVIDRKIERESLRAVVGFVMDLPYEWRAQGDYTWNRSTGDFLRGAFDLSTAGAASGAAFADGTLNPFVDTVAHPLDLARYFTPGDTYHYYAATSLGDIGLRFSGPLGELPAGKPNVTFGLGYREEEQDRSYLDRRGAGLTTYLPQSQTVSSAYVEALVPLVAPFNAVPGIRLLDFEVASRIEDFSVSTGTATRLTFPPDHAVDPDAPLVREDVDYSATNVMVGLRYKPVSALTVRASYATAFLPPGFADLLPGVVDPTELATGLDPQRGNERFSVPTLFGGNPDLEPMEAKSWNVGVIFEPGFLEGARFGIEWFRIERDNLIFAPNIIQLLANEAEFPGRVMRANPAPGDPYGVGPVTFFDLSRINASHVSTEGYDISFSYRRASERFGMFGVDLLATVVDEFTERYTLDGPEQDVAGQVANGGPLKLRANATFGWERGPWSLGWTVLYYGSYDQYDDPLYRAAQGGTTVPHQIYHDFLAGYRFDTDASGPAMSRALSDVAVTLGVRNVFNTVPRFDAFQENQQYYSPFGDYRLHTVQLSVGKRF